MLWTDTTSVLKYIKNEVKSFLTFVANIISAIREISTPLQWRYTGEWINGPSYLCKPVKIFDSTLKTDDPGVKRNMCVNSTIVNEMPNATNATHRLITHFSDSTKF